MKKNKTTPMDTLANDWGDLTSLMDEDADRLVMIPIEKIEVRPQVRKSFNEESLREFTEEIKARGVRSPIQVSPLEGGRYLLVAGERRLRASIILGKTLIPAHCQKLSDDEIEEAQLSENIHRDNLTNMEIALSLKRKVDRLGSVDAAIAECRKSKSWFHQHYALLTLPDHTKRLVTESITSDLQVINGVKAIEKAAPDEAKNLVESIKSDRGKTNTRKKVEETKAKVKAKKSDGTTKGEGALATPKDLSHEEPGAVTSLPGRLDTLVQESLPGRLATPASKADSESLPGRLPEAIAAKSSESLPGRPDEPAIAVKVSPTQIMANVFTQIYEDGKAPQAAFDALTNAEREDVEAWLQDHYDAGANSKARRHAIAKGIRHGLFGGDGAPCFALAAFEAGRFADDFDVIEILASAKD